MGPVGSFLFLGQGVHGGSKPARHKWAIPLVCRAMKAMPDQLILKRDPNARYTERWGNRPASCG